MCTCVSVACCSLGLVIDAHRPYRGQPWVSKVVLGQMDILGLGLMMLIDHVKEVLGQMGHLGPAIDAAQEPSRRQP